MKAFWLLVISAALTLCTTGVVPGSIVTTQAQAAGKAPGGAPRKTTRGKPRQVRFRSTQNAAQKVPATKQAASSGKKTERQSSGQSAKAAVPSATATPVAASTPKRARRKTGSRKRVSMTAVAGVSMSNAAPTTAAAGSSGRSSLNVNTTARSPRSRTVKQTSNAQRGRNRIKKRRRTTRGRSAKSALQTTSATAATKPTVNATPRTPVVAPPRQSRATDAVSTASSVLTRQGSPGGAVQQTAPPRQQGWFGRFVGKIKGAFKWR